MDKNIRTTFHNQVNNSNQVVGIANKIYFFRIKKIKSMYTDTMSETTVLHLKLRWRRKTSRNLAALRSL